MRKPKKFFWKDLSGRGFNNQFNQSGIVKAFAGEKNDNGQAIGAWAKSAEVGDECSNNANKFQRIE